jgi:hypothetical protein
VISRRTPREETEAVEMMETATVGRAVKAA